MTVRRPLRSRGCRCRSSASRWRSGSPATPARPVERVPLAHAAVGARQVVVAGDAEDHGASRGVEIQVLDVAVASLALEIAHQGVRIALRHGNRDRRAAGRGPRRAPVFGPDVIDVGARIDVAVDVAVEGRADLRAADVADPVVSRFAFGALLDGSQLPVGRPASRRLRWSARRAGARRRSG